MQTAGPPAPTGLRLSCIFLGLIVLSLAAEGQFLESIFSQRRSHDQGSSSDFVDGTSKHFLGMLFAPFDDGRSPGGVTQEGGMFSGLFGAPSRSGSVNYESYGSPQSPSSDDRGRDYQAGAYVCPGCQAGSTRSQGKEESSPAGSVYQCRGCGSEAYSSSLQSESYRSPKRYQESYEYPKPHHPQYHVIDTKLRVPPIKFRLHLSPKITIKTNAQDPLESKPPVDDEDYVPPEVHAHHHHNHGYYHPKRDGSGVDRQQPYGAHLIKHSQPVSHKYDPTFRIKIDPEIITDPPPLPPSSSTTTSSRLRASSRDSSSSAASTTTVAPAASSRARSAIHDLREASESGLSPLEAVLRRRSTTTRAPSTAEESTAAATSTTRSSTTSVTTGSSEREVEETTRKSSTTTDSPANNEVGPETAASTTSRTEKEKTATQDPRVAILKLREAAESGRSPFEALLASRRRPADDRKLIPRNSEKN